MITADQLRVPNEKQSLYIALFITFIIGVILLGISLGSFAILFFISIFYVKSQQGSLLGNAVKVTENQFPDLYNIVSHAAQRLSMPPPDVFIVQNPIINAYALGVKGRRSVVLHSALVEAMELPELASIIGHEFTHIKCEHTSWIILAGLHSNFKIPIISDLLSLIFKSWGRKSEYTCDRGGLIVNQDVNGSIKAMAKMAVGRELFEKLDIDIFKEQKSKVAHDDVARLSEMLQTHPFVVNRIQALINYSISSDYINLTSDTEKYDFGIFNDQNSVNETIGDEKKVSAFCTECGNDFPIDYLICMHCGATREE